MITELDFDLTVSGLHLVGGTQVIKTEEAVIAAVATALKLDPANVSVRAKDHVTVKSPYLMRPNVSVRALPKEEEFMFYERVGRQIRANTVWAIPDVRDFRALVPYNWQNSELIALEEYVREKERGPDGASHRIIATGEIKPRKEKYTWLELWLLVDRLWPIMMDPDHCFIEGFEPKKNDQNVRILVPFFGS